MPEVMFYKMMVSVNNAEPVPCSMKITHENETFYGRGYYPNPNWTHVDEQGHYHAAQGLRFNEVTYPTLKKSSRPCDGACGDPEDEEMFYVCRVCHEEIKPDGYYENRPVVLGYHTTLEVTIFASLLYGLTKPVSLRIFNEKSEWWGFASITDMTLSSEGSSTLLRSIGEFGTRNRKGGP